MADELDLIALRRPCYVTIPLTGRRVALRFFQAPQKQLYKQWWDEPNNAVLLVSLLRYAIPDITDDELNDLTIDEDIPNIVIKANGKAAMMESALKNGLSGGESPAPSPTPPSTLTTKSRTSSRRSAKRSKAGPPTFSKSSGTKSSSPSTG